MSVRIFSYKQDHRALKYHIHENELFDLHRAKSCVYPYSAVAPSHASEAKGVQFSLNPDLIRLL
jgi:hypothetical protein